METACFETKLGWITVKKNRGNVYSLSFGKTNKSIDLTDMTSVFLQPMESLPKGADPRAALHVSAKISPYFMSHNS